MKQLAKATSLTHQSQVYLLSQHSAPGPGVGRGQADRLAIAAGGILQKTGHLSQAEWILVVTSMSMCSAHNPAATLWENLTPPSLVRLS